MRPGTVLGTMEFGRGPCVGSVPEQMTSAFLAFDTDFKHIDTAFMYCGGKTQTILGDMESWKEKGLMGDKINPWDKKNFGEESIRMQVDTCLTRLKVPKVEIMYLHAPDHNTPLEVTLEVMDKLHKDLEKCESFQ